MVLMGLGSKPSLPTRAKIQSRKPSLDRQESPCIAQRPAKPPLLEQIREMDREQAAKGRVGPVPGQGHAAPSSNLAHLCDAPIGSGRMRGLRPSTIVIVPILLQCHVIGLK